MGGIKSALLPPCFLFDWFFALCFI